MMMHSMGSFAQDILFSSFESYAKNTMRLERPDIMSEPRAAQSSFDTL